MLDAMPFSLAEHELLSMYGGPVYAHLASMWFAKTLKFNLASVLCRVCLVHLICSYRKTISSCSNQSFLRQKNMGCDIRWNFLRLPRISRQLWSVHIVCAALKDYFFKGSFWAEHGKRLLKRWALHSILIS